MYQMLPSPIKAMFMRMPGFLLAVAGISAVGVWGDSRWWQTQESVTYALNSVSQVTGGAKQEHLISAPPCLDLK